MGHVQTDLTEYLHDRALTYLWVRLREQRDHARRRGPYERETDERETRAEHEGVLLALQRVGAISGEEAAHWRRRLHDAVAWQAPAFEPPSEEVAARAADHLERLLAAVSQSSVGAYTGAVTAYLHMGILTADEAVSWSRRLPTFTYEMPPSCSGYDLLGVIAGPAVRMHGLRITRVELFADGLFVHWHLSRREEPPGPTPAMERLTDDVGTDYSRDRGWSLAVKQGGGWITRFGADTFTPAVPSHARCLHFPLSDEGVLHIDIGALR